MAQPNAIIVLADAFRLDCAPYANNSDLKTPNLGALVKHGLYFDQAITQHPLTHQARATLLTGQYPSGHGAALHSSEPSMSAVSLPHLLQNNGYTTAAIGNTGINYAGDAYGFDTLKKMGTPESGADDYLAWLAEATAAEESEKERSRTAWIGNQAIRFLQSAQEPFFLLVCFTLPHTPLDPPPRWNATYDPRTLNPPANLNLAYTNGDTPAEDRSKLARYYATISHMDSQIGRILATVAGRGHTNNVVVFTSDRGWALGADERVEAGAPPHDVVLRIPLIVSGVTGQRYGETEHAPVELADVMPTLLDVAGCTPPPEISGRSLLPLLRDPDVTHRKAAYSESTHGIRLVRTQQYKFIEFPDERNNILYDLENDPNETTNLLGAPQTIGEQVKLTQLLRRIR